MTTHKRPKLSGIYIIENLIDGKSYVGSSSDIFRRWAWHLSSLRNNTHNNAYLQRAFNKYSEQNFDFAVVELSEINSMATVETYWIQSLGTSESGLGYNLTSTAAVPSDATRLKMSKNNSKRKHSEETKNRISNAMKGRKFSAEHLKNNRAALSAHYAATTASEAKLADMAKAARAAAYNVCNNKHGIKGVTHHKDLNNPWKIVFRNKGKLVTLGYYADIELASLVSSETEAYLFIKNELNKIQTKNITTYVSNFQKQGTTR